MGSMILAVLVAVFLVAGPTDDGIDWSRRPADWPELKIEYIYTENVVQICSERIGYFDFWEGCATADFDKGTCEVVLYPNGMPWVKRHEEAHCKGYDHPDSSHMATGWELHKAKINGRSK